MPESSAPRLWTGVFWARVAKAALALRSSLPLQGAGPSKSPPGHRWTLEEGSEASAATRQEPSEGLGGPGSLGCLPWKLELPPASTRMLR